MRSGHVILTKTQKLMKHFLLIFPILGFSSVEGYHYLLLSVWSSFLSWSCGRATCCWSTRVRVGNWVKKVGCGWNLVQRFYFGERNISNNGEYFVEKVFNIFDIKRLVHWIVWTMCMANLGICGISDFLITMQNQSLFISIIM